MRQLSFKNRIASNYLITTALLIFVVFFAIYYSVRLSVYSRVNNDIKNEVEKHLLEIKVRENCVLLIREEEWREQQYNMLDVNPAFVEFVDELGAFIDKSPNLKKLKLKYHPEIKNNELFDTKLDVNTIRQIQVPLYQNTKIIGYLLVAMSLEDSKMVLNNLSKVLILSYPLILILLFLIARFIAGRSIKPISSIISTSNIISKDNLSSRIHLPQNRDELYTLSQTINNLLDRIENAIEREKQFTSDASHELRTPLAVIKGTMEVLIRKSRSQEEYEDKINFCISEVNRLNHLVDQLLLLARFENQNQTLKIEHLNLNSLILETISRYSSVIKSKKIKVSTQFDTDYYVDTDAYLFSIIINNLVSNALKYSNNNSKLDIQFSNENDNLICTIADTGVGIPAEDLQKIFDQFYRSKSSDIQNVKGTGLGLSIVKRLCTLLDIEIAISSEENRGTTVALKFKSQNT